MPQLDPTGFAPQLVWLAITFFVLYLIMSRVALPRIGQTLAAREEHISRDLADAEQLKKEAEDVQEAYEAALAEARSKAHAIALQARDDIRADLARAQADLDTKLAKQAEAADARIAEAMTTALAGLDDLAREVAEATVAQLTGQAPDRGAIDQAVRNANAGRERAS